MQMSPELHKDIVRSVKIALEEDVGSGDITAALIAPQQQAKAHVISREAAVICGVAWVNEVFNQVDANVNLEWLVADGDHIEPNQRLFTATGSARAILTAERAALNFLQTLSGTATISQFYADKVADTNVKLLDTRKTLPGLRSAQKYAVTCGSCHNHRIGLFDAYLIKENHIMACGGIEKAVSQAKQQAPGKLVEIEVENLTELDQAVDAGAHIVMLDNFETANLERAVAQYSGRVKLEASGNVTDETLLKIAQTGVDYISIGALTKHCQALDLSMRFQFINA